jgi:hypothetical protein
MNLHSVLGASKKIYLNKMLSPSCFKGDDSSISLNYCKIEEITSGFGDDLSIWK